MRRPRMPKRCINDFRRNVGTLARHDSALSMSRFTCEHAVACENRTCHFLAKSDLSGDGGEAGARVAALMTGMVGAAAGCA